MRARMALFVAVVALVLAGCGGGSGSPRRVTIALDFTPNGVHAGIYATVQKNFDLKHGVNLVIRQPTASTDSLKLLAAGRADLAVVDIHDLGLAAQRGADIVGVGALVDRPLASVIAQPSITRPRQLEGRRVGVTGLPSDIAVLKSMVNADGGSYARVKTVTIGFSAVADLITRKVDAATAFWNAEGVTLKQRGVHVNVFRADEFGAPRYPELVIATRRSLLKRDPDLIKRGLAALGQGSNAARADPTVALGRIVAASGSDKSLIRAELDAVRPILAPDVALNFADLRAWAEFDARFGILKRAPNVHDLFKNVSSSL